MIDQDHSLKLNSLYLLLVLQGNLTNEYSFSFPNYDRFSPNTENTVIQWYLRLRILCLMKFLANKTLFSCFYALTNEYFIAGLSNIPVNKAPAIGKKRRALLFKILQACNNIKSVWWWCMCVCGRDAHTSTRYISESNHEDLWCKRLMHGHPGGMMGYREGNCPFLGFQI